MAHQPCLNDSIHLIKGELRHKPGDTIDHLRAEVALKIFDSKTFE